MQEALPLLASTLAGAALGLVFFWGLWRTVQGLRNASRPALLMLASLLLRFGVVVIGYYLLARHAGWQHVLAAAIGFTVVRLFIVRRVRHGPLDDDSTARGSDT